MIFHVNLIQKGYQSGEWENEFYYWKFVVTEDFGERNEVEVTTSLIKKGDWTVVVNGAIDFTGNKKDY